MKKVLTLIVVLMVTLSSWADIVRNVKYIDSEGYEKTCPVATVITSSDDLVELEAGWYVAQDSYIALSGGAECTGDVHIILADGASLNISTNIKNSTALYVGSANTLAIYGQKLNSGTLTATASNIGAGIGGEAAAIIINGGRINATGNYGGAGIGAGFEQSIGTITVNGGHVTARGGEYAAGIGTGFGAGSQNTSNCDAIIINGGRINAYGNDYASAIGKGYNGICSDITFNGGTIYASTTASDEKAIYGHLSGTIHVSSGMRFYSDENAQPTTLIYDGTASLNVKNIKQYAKLTTVAASNVKYIDANGEEQTCSSAKIVSSGKSHVEWDAGWYVVKRDSVNTISGGVDCVGDVHLILEEGARLTIDPGSAGEGITGLYIKGVTLQIYGQRQNSGTLIVNSDDGCAGIGGGSDAALIINGGTIQATGGNGGAGIGCNDASDFGDITINGGNVTAHGGGDASAIGDGEGGPSCKSLTINPELFVYAGSEADPTTLIENDGSDISRTLTQGYVTVRVNPLSVKYIDADGNEQTCLEPALLKSSAERIVLTEGWYVAHGSEVTYDDGLDIKGDVHIILTDGSKVTVSLPSTTTYKNAINIFDGYTLQIYGQKNNSGILNASVTGRDFPAISGDGTENAVIINGGTINATAGPYSAGIGSMSGHSFGDITINGGDVTATCGNLAAGIGSGTNGSCGAITINGGNINATGGVEGAGIGTGRGASCGNISINGGTITAAGGSVYGGDGANSWGQAIGNGYLGNCGGIVIKQNMLALTGFSANPSTAVENTGASVLGKFNRYATVATDYLIFTGIDNGAVRFEKIEDYAEIDATIEYCRDLFVVNQEWTEYEYGTDLSLGKRAKIYFRARGTDGRNSDFSVSSSRYIKFCSSGKVAASGNIMSLLSSDCFAELSDYTFNSLFYNCANLTSAPALPATKMGKYCYDHMFSGCTGLTEVPQLPATNLAEGCYRSMFYGCSGLKLNTMHIGKSWSIPADATEAKDWNSLMFECTGGTFTGQPVIGTIYYYLYPTGIAGDVNDDSKVDILDIVHLIDYLKAPAKSLIDIDNADVDSDGAVTTADIESLQKLILGNE